MKIKSLKITKAFKYFALCYILLLLCVMIPVGNIFTQAVHLNRQNALSISQLNLNTCASEIDGAMSAVVESAMQVSKSKDLILLSHTANKAGGDYAYNLYRALTNFQTCLLQTYNLSEGFLYYPSSNIVINGSGTYQSIENYCFLHNIDYHKLIDSLTNVLSSGRMFEIDNVIYIAAKCIFDYSVNNVGYLCYSLPDHKIKTLMRTDYSDSKYALITKNGDVLSSDLPLKTQSTLILSLAADNKDAYYTTLDRNEYMICRHAARDGDILYVSIVPRKSVDRTIKMIDDHLVFTLCLAAVLALIVVCFLSRRNTKLIRGFVSEASDGNGVATKDEFNELIHGIRTMKSCIADHQIMIARQRTALSTAFLWRLMNGAFMSNDEMVSAMNDAGVIINGQRYAAALLSLIDSRLYEGQMIKACSSPYVYTYPINEVLIAALVVLGKDESAEQVLESVFKEDFKSFGVFTGLTSDSLMEVNASYNDAYKQYCMSKKSGEMDADDASSDLEIKIRTFIMENYQDPALSLSMLAAALGNNEAYLSAYFKRRTGRNISNLIEQMRVDKAIDLLTNSDKPIKDVMLNCGYQSYQTFLRVVKKHTQCTPKQLRTGESEDEG